jgi:hypothetical protein
MAVTKETLRRMAEEFGMLPMSDEELEKALPTVQANVEVAVKLRELDLSQVFAARVVRHDGQGVQRGK